MNINPSMGTAQPSFQAKFKENRNYKELLGKLDAASYRECKENEALLDRFSQGDVLEIYTRKDPNAALGKVYGVRNLNKKGAKIELDSSNPCPQDQLYWLMFDLISHRGNANADTLLTKPAQSDPRTFGEKLGRIFGTLFGGGSSSFGDVPIR